MKEGQEILLPEPRSQAYFPETGPSEILANEALRRAGGNLDYAIEYGSTVAGDATPTSMRDMILVVRNAKDFHRRNMEMSARDYGLPHLPDWHTFLNKFGLNYYQTTITSGEKVLPIKYAVISTENFIRGCNGTLPEKEKDKTGAFGFYVAGRIQKAALRPLKTGNEDTAREIEQAINTARIDGLWLSLGLLGSQFSLDELIEKYVSLSYRADLRVEKPGKIQTLIRQSKADYLAMLDPILNDFNENGLVRKIADTEFEKIKSLTQNEVEKRLRELKLQTAVANYVKNPLTMGVGRGIKYALQKVGRSIEAQRMNHPSDPMQIFPQSEKPKK